MQVIRLSSALLCWLAVLGTLPVRLLLAQSEASYEQGVAFSPSGRLYQVEFAAEAALRHGAPTVCIRGRHKCVVACRRRAVVQGGDPSSLASSSSSSPAAAAAAAASAASAAAAAAELVDAETVQHVHAISKSVGFAASGVPGDEAVQVRLLRDAALAFRRGYGHEMAASRLAVYLADRAQEATQGTGEFLSRPLGTAAFVLGSEEPQDERGGIEPGKTLPLRRPVAFRVEPSGQVFLCATASCAGRHSDAARRWLDDHLKVRQKRQAVERRPVNMGSEEGEEEEKEKEEKGRAGGDDGHDDDDDTMEERPTSTGLGYSLWGEPTRSYDGGIYGAHGTVPSNKGSASRESAEKEKEKEEEEEEELEDLMGLALGCLAHLPPDEEYPERLMDKLEHCIGEGGQDAAPGSSQGHSEGGHSERPTDASRFFHVGIAGGGAPFRFASGHEMTRALAAFAASRNSAARASKT